MFTFALLKRWDNNTFCDIFKYSQTCDYIMLFNDKCSYPHVGSVNKNHVLVCGKNVQFVSLSEKNVHEAFF